MSDIVPEMVGKLEYIEREAIAVIAERDRLRAETAAQAKRIASQQHLLEHIWLHVTSDEDFDADELKRDLERSGEINEMRGLLAETAAQAKRIAELELQVARVREQCAAKAREFAGHYPQSSDGRNTFIILAEWIDALPLPTPDALQIVGQLVEAAKELNDAASDKSLLRPIAQWAEEYPEIREPILARLRTALLAIDAALTAARKLFGGGA